ncbi:putative TBC domain-containing protein [Neospora caninum Liverpool]|uniref:Putative TBC domain-containing protein n=1 Tax=Neospora caninum (strain Liverpool) TaxID=572307 RepID=F0VN66_NEOCL|nr:putative TBC domain-containing protein [Neospora caninum Liverpool]CBZ55162.1 putative TBC domain-containing protein [Neospora caninum Liverpool]CEL69888.1 TPA: TBC domain-containing protein, putative [Neospora caninum Liverpool]|eukprot:XP_003885190.1 putative TBC domain-containing protein [Neospora caninum Liverpool]
MAPSAARLQTRRRPRRSAEYPAALPLRGRHRESPPLPEEALSNRHAPVAQEPPAFYPAPSSSESFSSGALHGGKRGGREDGFAQPEELGAADDSHIDSSGESRHRRLREAPNTMRCDTGGSVDESVPEDACDSAPSPDLKPGVSLCETGEWPGQPWGREKTARRRSSLAGQSSDGDKDEREDFGGSGSFRSPSRRSSVFQGECRTGFPRRTERTRLPPIWRGEGEIASGESDHRLGHENRRQGRNDNRNRSDSAVVERDKDGAIDRPPASSLYRALRHLGASPTRPSFSAALAFSPHRGVATSRPPPPGPPRGLSVVTPRRSGKSPSSCALSPPHRSASRLVGLESPSAPASPRRESWSGFASGFEDESGRSAARGRSSRAASPRSSKSTSRPVMRAESSPPVREKERKSSRGLSANSSRDLINAFASFSIAHSASAAAASPHRDGASPSPATSGLHADSRANNGDLPHAPSPPPLPAAENRRHGSSGEAGEARGRRDEWGETGSRRSSGSKAHEISRASRRPSASERDRSRGERARSGEESGRRSRRTSSDLLPAAPRTAAGVPPFPSLGELAARSRRRDGERRAKGDSQSVCSTLSRLSSYSASPDDADRVSAPPSRRSSRGSARRLPVRGSECRSRTRFRGDEDRMWSTLGRRGHRRSIPEASSGSEFASSSEDDDSLFPYCAEGTEYAFLPCADPSRLGSFPTRFAPSKLGFAFPGQAFPAVFGVDEAAEGCGGYGGGLHAAGDADGPLPGWWRSPGSSAPSSTVGGLAGSREMERGRADHERPSHTGAVRRETSRKGRTPSPSRELLWSRPSILSGVGRLSALQRFLMKRGRTLGRGEDDEGAYISHFAMTEKLRQEAQLRACLDKAVLLFNQLGLEPAVAVLEEQGILRKTDPEAIAVFLYETPGLDKRKVGALLGDASPFNISILRAFSSLFDVRGLSIDLALRSIFSRFIPPGESQQLYRVLYFFAELYVQQNPEQNMDAETAHFLAYAILLLHTDRHNRNVKRKITKEDWRRMTRGRDGTPSGLDVKTLDAIYDRVVAEQFKLHMSDADKVYLRLSRDPRVLRYAAGRESPFFRVSTLPQGQHVRVKTSSVSGVSPHFSRRVDVASSHSLASRAPSRRRDEASHREGRQSTSRDRRRRSPDPLAPQPAPVSRSSPLPTERRQASQSPGGARGESCHRSSTSQVRRKDGAEDSAGGQSGGAADTADGKKEAGRPGDTGDRGEVEQPTGEATPRSVRPPGGSANEVDRDRPNRPPGSGACTPRHVDGSAGEKVEATTEGAETRRSDDGAPPAETLKNGRDGDNSNPAVSVRPVRGSARASSSDSPPASSVSCEASGHVDPSDVLESAGAPSASPDAAECSSSTSSSPCQSPGLPPPDNAAGVCSKSPSGAASQASQTLVASPGDQGCRDSAPPQASAPVPPTYCSSSASVSTRPPGLHLTQPLAFPAVAETPSPRRLPRPGALGCNSHTSELEPQLAEGKCGGTSDGRGLLKCRSSPQIVAASSSAAGGAFRSLRSESLGAVSRRESPKSAAPVASGLPLRSQSPVLLRRTIARMQSEGPNYMHQASVFSRGVSLRGTSELSRQSTASGLSPSVPTFGSLTANLRSTSSVLSFSPYSSSFAALERGTVFLKLCRNGKMKPRLLSVDSERSLLCWRDPKKGGSAAMKVGKRSPRCLPLDELFDITLGCLSTRDTKPSDLSEDMELRCFSLHFVTRSLDLLAPLDGSLLCPFSPSPPVAGSRRLGPSGEPCQAAAAPLTLWLSFFHAKIAELQQVREQLLQQQHALAQSAEVAARRRKRREEEAAEKLELWRTLILPHWDKCWTCGAVPQAPTGGSPVFISGAPSRIGTWRRFPSMLRGDIVHDRMGSRLRSVSRSEVGDRGLWRREQTLGERLEAAHLETLGSKASWRATGRHLTAHHRPRGPRLASGLSSWGPPARLSTGTLVAAVRTWWGLGGSGEAGRRPGSGADGADEKPGLEKGTKAVNGAAVGRGEGNCVDGSDPPSLFEVFEVGSEGEREEGSTLPPHSEEPGRRAGGLRADRVPSSSLESLWSHRDGLSGAERGRPSTRSPTHGASLGQKLFFPLRFLLPNRRSSRTSREGSISVENDTQVGGDERRSPDDGKHKALLRNYRSLASFAGFAWLFASSRPRPADSPRAGPSPGAASSAESSTYLRTSSAVRDGVFQEAVMPNACAPNGLFSSAADAPLQGAAGNPSAGDTPGGTPRVLVGTLSRLASADVKSGTETRSLGSGAELRDGFSPGCAIAGEAEERGIFRGREEGLRAVGTQAFGGNPLRPLAGAPQAPHRPAPSFGSAALSRAPSQRDFRAWGEEPQRSRRFWRVWFPQFFGARFSLDRGRRLETAVSTALVELWLQGLPGELRGTLWGVAIGNEQRVSEGLLSSLLFLVLQRRRLVQKSQDAMRSRNRSSRSSASPFGVLQTRGAHGSDRRAGPPEGDTPVTGGRVGGHSGRIGGADLRTRREWTGRQQDEKRLDNGRSKAESSRPPPSTETPPAAAREAETTRAGACSVERCQSEPNRTEVSASSPFMSEGCRAPGSGHRPVLRRDDRSTPSMSIGLPYPGAGLWYLVDKKVACGPELLISCLFEARLTECGADEEGGRLTERGRDEGSEGKKGLVSGDKRQSHRPQGDAPSTAREDAPASVCFRPAPSAETVARMTAAQAPSGCGEKNACADRASNPGEETARREAVWEEAKPPRQGEEIKSEKLSAPRRGSKDPRVSASGDAQEDASPAGEVNPGEKEKPHNTQEGDKRERDDERGPNSKQEDAQSRRGQTQDQRRRAHLHSIRPWAIAATGRVDGSEGMTIGEAVRRLLQAYELYRPDIGAVRGMDCLASILLCFMSLPAAFVAFVNLLPSFHLLDFYAPAEQASRRLLSVKFEFFDGVLRSRVPSLHRHFKGLRIHANLYLLQWLETLFANVLPFQTLCQTWDAILLLGEGFTFQVALGLLKYYEAELLANSFEGCMVILSRTARPDDDETGAFDSQRFFQCVDVCPVDRQQYSRLLANQRAADEKTELLNASTRTAV